MITSDMYLKNTVKLVKSFTIKHDDIAIHINNELIKLYGTSILGNDPSDKSKWKYYMNICGLYHPIDNPIKITIIETGTVKDLSKELLIEYPTTRDELLKHDVFYEDLLNNYPNDELLIKGIMYELDMEFVLSMENGYLLSYSRFYVEEQEGNLIQELSKYSINYFKRWHIREYGIVDNLYLASLLGTLYTKLVLKVINIRYSNIMTSNVHSFHIYEFFRSHFDVDTTVLNKSTRFWLYKNMKYIRKHMGSNQTLNTIIEKILTNNGIGIAEIELINTLPSIQLLDLDDVTKPLYDKKTNDFVSKVRNKYYFISDSDNLTSYQQLYLQFNRNLVENDLVIHDTRDIENKYLPKLDYNILHRQKTKTFKIKINKSHVVIQETSMKLLLDNWTYLALNDKFRAIKKFIDPNTGIVYNITPKQGLYMVYKLLSKMNNVDNPIIKGYTSNFTLHNNITLEELTNNLLRNDVIETIATKFYDSIPKVMTYVDGNGFNSYIKELTTFRSMMWNVGTNTTDMLLMSDIQVMYKRLHKRVYIDFNTDKTIDELITGENMYYTLTEDYDYRTVIIMLFDLFTGYKIIDNDIENTINKYIDITKKLSSYTVQFISDVNDLNIVPMRYHSLDTINAGVVDLRDSTFRALEDFYGMLDGKAILYSNYMDVDVDIDNTIDKSVPPLELVMYEMTIAEVDRIEVINNVGIVADNISSIDLYKPKIDGTSTEFNEHTIIVYDNDIDNGILDSKNIDVIMTNDDNIDKIDIIVDVSDLGIRMYKPVIDGISNDFKETNFTLYDNNISRGQLATNNISMIMSNDDNIDNTNIVTDVSDLGILLYKPTIDNIAVNENNIDSIDTNLEINKIDVKDLDLIIYEDIEESKIISSNNDKGINLFIPNVVGNKYNDDTILLEPDMQTVSKSSIIENPILIVNDNTIDTIIVDIE